MNPHNEPRLKKLLRYIPNRVLLSIYRIGFSYPFNDLHHIDSSGINANIHISHHTCIVRPNRATQYAISTLCCPFNVLFTYSHRIWFVQSFQDHL